MGGRTFFLFFQEKKRKNQRKETLTDKENRSGPMHPLPFYFVDFLLVLFFPERKGRREDVLSFLSGKEKKEPKKRNLNGKGKRERANAPAFSLSVDFLLVLFFPERKGRKEKRSFLALFSSGRRGVPCAPVRFPALQPPARRRVAGEHRRGTGRHRAGRSAGRVAAPSNCRRWKARGRCPPPGGRRRRAQSVP